MRRNVFFAACSAFLVAGLALYAYLHRSEMPLFSVGGPVALGERDVIVISFLLCCIVIVPVFVMLFSFAWLYQAGHPRARKHYFPNWDHHTRAAEITWWLVPAAIIFFLSILSWQSTNALDPYKPLPGDEQIEVQVVALDWKWLFLYPKEGIASVNSLVIPEHTPVHLELTADAPVNSFWIPALAGQIMVMPGMATQLNILASKEGTFAGASANISGAGFAGMHFEVHALPADQYARWVQEAKSAGSPLTLATYQKLAAPSENDPVKYYAPVDASVYPSIIGKYQGSMQMNMAM